MCTTARKNRKAYKIRIVPALKESFSIAFEAKKQILILSWLSLVLLTIVGITDQHSPIVDLIIDHLIFVPWSFFYGLSLDYLFHLFDLLITTCFIFATYRYFILSKQDQAYVWAYKRGIFHEKTILSIPWYFRLGKKELQIIAFYASVGGVLYVLRQTNAAMMFYFEGSHSTYITGSYIIWLIEGLAYATLILITPAIAVAKDFKFSKAFDLIKMLRGNIIRIFIIGQIIYLPLKIFNHLYYSIVDFLFPIDRFDLPILDDIYLVLANALYFICITIDCAFISLIYKKFNA